MTYVVITFDCWFFSEIEIVLDKYEEYGIENYYANQD